MREVYEQLIEMVEERDVTVESDEVLQMLGEEMNSSSCGPALVQAASFLVQDPATDPGPLARLKRLCTALGFARGCDLDERVSLLGFFFLDEMKPSCAA